MPGKSAEKERRAYVRTSVLTHCSTADCAPGRRPARFAAVGSGCRQAHRRGGDGHRPDQVRADRREGNMRIHTIVLAALLARSEEHTSELQSLMRISYAVFCLKKKTQIMNQSQNPNEAKTYK